ncbi:hypothetical protein NP236_20920, partial [Salmonella enterica]|nr:hypothetical protein [Salmonella enterica]
SLKTSIKTITYLSDIGCLEIQGASLIPIENIHEAVELVYDRNTSMVNIVGVDYEKEIKGSDSCSCVIIQCLLCSYG